MNSDMIQIIEQQITNMMCILELTGHTPFGHTYTIINKHIITGEPIYIEIVIRTETILNIIKDIEEDIRLAEFENARIKIKKYKTMGIYLPEFSIFETRMTRIEMLAEE